ncbi:MAG: serine/threonine protein kinase, partial [Planctomycetes bacterium]|nr:serine/threonine protein kinase [Planctomycetota bacterium]
MAAGRTAGEGSEGNGGAPARPGRRSERHGVVREPRGEPGAAHRRPRCGLSRRPRLGRERGAGAGPRGASRRGRRGAEPPRGLPRPGGCGARRRRSPHAGRLHPPPPGRARGLRRRPRRLADLRGPARGLEGPPRRGRRRQRSFFRFLREAKAAAQLSHPNVVGVHGMGVEGQTPWYSMELVEGETLAEILARRRAGSGASPFGPGEEGLAGLAGFARLAAALAGAADGLQHAHEHGVVHRDVKPSNLICDREGKLRILDFGLARLEGQKSLTVSGDLVGTPLYMSPEQARRRKVEVDRRTDIWSLGATLYEMLALRPPFQGKDHQDTLSQIIEREPVPPRRLDDRIPRDLETIVLKCLRKDPAGRYGTAEALAQDLRRFARGEPVEARPQSRLERLAARARAHRGRLAAGAAIALLLALVA